MTMPFPLTPFFSEASRGNSLFVQGARATIAVAITLICGLASTSVAQTVHVVDAMGAAGSDFTTVSEAVDAAVNGDVVLIRAGSYVELVVVDEKTLVLHAEAGAFVEVLGLEVRNLTSAQFVVVRGLSAEGLWLNGSTLDVHDNAGVVWIEDVIASGYNANGVTVSDCATVVLRNCRFTSKSYAQGFGATLSVTRSNLYVYDGVITGRDSWLAPGFGGGSVIHDALPALDLTNSAGWLYGASVAGGTGAASTVTSGRSGGDGVVVLSAAFGKLWTLGATVLGGGGGTGAPGMLNGAPGTPFVLNGQTRVDIWNAPRFETLTSPVREKATLTATQSGVPGDSIWTYYSTRPRAPFTGRRWDGPFALGAPLANFANGSIPASGMRTSTPTIGEFGAGVEAVGIFAQSVMRDATTGRFIASAPTFLLLLDEGI